MKLLTFKVPETEHLPVTDREEILNRCLASEQMRRYRRIAPPICGIVPTAIAFSFFFLALFRWGWSFFPACVTFFAIILVSIALALLTKVTLEVWVLRRLIRREVRK